MSPEEAVESMRSLTGNMICPLVFGALEEVVSRREALVFVDHHHADERRGVGEEMPAELDGQVAKSA